MDLYWCLSATTLALVLLLLPLYRLLRHIYSYWSRHHFPHLPPSIPWGCLRPVVIDKSKSFGELIRDIHLDHPDAPFLGLYMFFRPILLVRDPHLVKRILITDFDHFHDRGVFYNEDTDPVGANLFAMPGHKWRDMRAKLSPIFTSGKLKSMFPVMAEKTELLHHHLDRYVQTNSQVRLKELVSQCIISTLASVFFGLEINALDEPDHEIVTMGQQFFETETFRQKFTNLGVFLFPQIFELFRLPIAPQRMIRGALNLMLTATKVRQAEPLEVRSRRNDFIQTILQLMDEGLRIELCTAQAFLFYGAGYETSATTATFCLYELSKCPEWMAKVRKEVDELMERRQGPLVYEDLADLKQLELCLQETMRKYPAVPLLNRECTKDYRIPGTDHTILKGTPIIISNLGLQMDEKFYPDPEKFDPSRFEGDDRPLETFPYYPAGAGPRYCIGEIQTTH